MDGEIPLPRDRLSGPLRDRSSSRRGVARVSLDSDGAPGFADQLRPYAEREHDSGVIEAPGLEVNLEPTGMKLLLSRARGRVSEISVIRRALDGHVGKRGAQNALEP